MRVRFIEESCDVLFLARIEPARDAAAALGFDLGFEFGEFVGGPPPGKNRVALTREAFGDGRTDKVSRADHRTGGIALGHACLLSESYSLRP